MHCRQVEPALAGYLHALTPERKRRAVAAHLERCPACRVRLEAFRTDLQMLPELSALQPGHDLARAAMLRWHEERAISPIRRPWRPLAACAAAAVLAVGCLVLGTSPPTPRLKGRGVIVSRDRTRETAPPSLKGRGPGGLGRGGAKLFDLLVKSAPGFYLPSSVGLPHAPKVRADHRQPANARLASSVVRRTHPLPDSACLDGTDPLLLSRWMTGDPNDGQVRAWLKRLPPVKDDFVDVPLPLLASADPKSAAAADALRRYEKEASVVDPRLFRRVSLALKAAPLAELCASLQKQTGVRMEASRAVADENVTALLEDQPARDVLREVARLFGYKWSRSGTEGAYRYELIQDLRGQLAEEEMRSRDIHAALVSLDDQMAKFQPYLDLTPEQLKAREKTAQGEEAQLLKRLDGTEWGAIQLYYRLTPAQHLALADGGFVEFRSDAPQPDLRIPAEWRQTLLERSKLSVSDLGGRPALVPDGMFGPGGKLLTDIPGSIAVLSLNVERSELGQVKLECGHGGAPGNDPSILVGGAYWRSTLASGVSPSQSRPDNAKANAALRGLPEFKPVVSFKPEVICPWFSPDAKIEDQEGFYPPGVHGRNGERIWIGPDGQMGAGEQPPHVESAQVWEALHRTTGIPIIADAYSRVFDLKKLCVQKQSAFDALCRVSDEMGVRWTKDSDFVLARSTAYFWDKLKEVPVRLIRRWSADREQTGYLPLDDLIEMASMPDAALNSQRVGYVLGHCRRLEEWAMVGTGGAFRLGLPGGAWQRERLRFLAMLDPAQRRAALQPGGLALVLLTDAQQQAFLHFAGHTQPEVLKGLRFHVDYVPVGAWVWHPSVDTAAESDEGGRKWPVVTGRTREGALAEARRYQPQADEGSIRRSRGVLAFTCVGGNGETWKDGAPAIGIHVHQE